jgi:hypothetical protein
MQIYTYSLFTISSDMPDLLTTAGVARIELSGTAIE